MRGGRLGGALALALTGASFVAGGAACGPPGVHAGEGPRRGASSHAGAPGPRPDPVDAEPAGAAGAAAYLRAAAATLGPPWSQFTADCAARLPAAHPLNALARVADVELAIDRAGAVELVTPPASGDADFDAAVRGVVRDASPLRAPPADLLADDDHVHVRWRFARDPRRSGPLGLANPELPLSDVVARAAAAGDLARAARRLARAAPDDAAAATTLLMIEVLREALGSGHPDVQRAAVRAIGRAHVDALAGELRARISPPTDAALRVDVAAALAELGDAAAAPRLRDALIEDLRAGSGGDRAPAGGVPGDAPREPAASGAGANASVIDAGARALVALGRAPDVAAALATAPASPAAIAALAVAPDPSRTSVVLRASRSADPRLRAAACIAWSGARMPRIHVPRGLRDPDARVRAACAATAATSPSLAPELRALLRDRDDAVRAAAVAALVAIDAGRPPAVTDDPSPAVRAALASPRASDATLRALAGDADDLVRAAALGALSARGDLPADLAQAATVDPSPRVRRLAAPAIVDPTLLARLADDPNPDVASAALVRRTAQLGARASLADLLARLAAAPPGSAERVRVALAWLLAS